MSSECSMWQSWITYKALLLQGEVWYLSLKSPCVTRLVSWTIQWLHEIPLGKKWDLPPKKYPEWRAIQNCYIYLKFALDRKIQIAYVKRENWALN